MFTGKSNRLLVLTLVCFRWSVVVFILTGLWFIPAACAKTSLGEGADDFVELPTLRVKGEMLEDFGFRVSPDFDVLRSTKVAKLYSPVVDLVLPNTAASKAGVRPGDRILLSDGEVSVSGSSSLRKWREIQKKKWAEVEARKHGVIWTLQVETAETGKLRTLTLQLPTAAPRWASTVWRTPEDRVLVEISEPGPLAERAQQVLNNGIWMLLRASYVRGFRLPNDAEHPHFLCYQWTLWSGSVGHRMYVSRQRGHTDIVLEAIYRTNTPLFSGGGPAATPDETLSSATTVLATDARTYLTSPSGKLEMAWRLNRQQEEIPLDAARAGFEAEVDFWLNHVGKVSPLWPLGVIESARK